MNFLPKHIQILKKDCSGAIVKAFIVITIIKTIIMTKANNDKSNSNNDINNK